MQGAFISFGLTLAAGLSACGTAETKPAFSAPVPGPVTVIPGKVHENVRTQDALISYLADDGTSQTYVIRDATDTLIRQNAEAICRLDGKPTDTLRMSGAVFNYGKAKPRVFGMKCT